LLIERNNISNNDDRVRISGSSFTFTGNNITSNSVVSGTGALYISGDSSGDITDNKIDNNANNGLYMDRTVDDTGVCSMSISGNTITQNDGFGIFLVNCDPDETREELDAQNIWWSGNTDGRIKQRWRFRVHVIDGSDQDVADAYVDVKDEAGAKVYTELTPDITELCY
jgi:hypothetical protein